MKQCVNCGVKKDASEFHKCGHAADGLQFRCKECRQIDFEITRDRDNARRRFVYNHAGRDRTLINQIKDVPCKDCGGKFPPCSMDFDHRPGTKKAFNMAHLAGQSEIRIRAEAVKCDIVCANCHRVRTFKRGREKALERLKASEEILNSVKQRHSNVDYFVNATPDGPSTAPSEG